MRLLFVNPRYDPTRWDGARVHITQLAENLRHLGHELLTFPHCAGGPLRPLASTGFTKLRELSGMDAFYLRIEGVPPVLPRFMRWPLNGLFRRVPVVWEINATPQLRQLGFDESADEPEHLRFACFRRLACRTSLAICNTKGLADYAGDLGIKRRVVVPLGSNPDLFRPDSPGSADIPLNPEGLNVVWCGNAAIHWHDLDSILAAARALLSEPRIRFYIAAKEIPCANIPPNVCHLGERPYAEMPGILAGMDVGLCLYRKEDWTSYGTFSSPLKLFDYLAVGLIVVASPIEQVRECFARGDAGFTVPFEDPSALADILKRILRDKPRMHAKRVAARSLVTQYYNWRRVAEETVHAIEGL